VTNETILKEILRGEPQLDSEVLRAVSDPAASVGPQLLELIRNIRLWHTEDAGQWAVLHAIRLVSGLHLRNSVGPLIDAIFLAYSTRHEEALEDLPTALAQLGASAIRPLASVLEDRALEATIRSVAGSALEGIAVLHPSERESVLESLRKVVADASDLTAVRSHVITIVAHFRQIEDIPLIKNVARSLPMMLDMDADEIDEYFRQDEEPDEWAAYRGDLLDYYR
jgi:hypothetical protein